MLFNPSSSDVYVMASEMKLIFEEKFAKIPVDEPPKPKKPKKVKKAAKIKIAKKAKEPRKESEMTKMKRELDALKKRIARMDAKGGSTGGRRVSNLKKELTYERCVH